MRRWLVVFLLMVCLPVKALALVLDDQVERLELSDGLRVLEDPSRSATIAEVAAPARNDAFRAITSEVFNAGYSRSAFWLRLDLGYRPHPLAERTPRTWLLELAYPPLDKVELYLPDGQGGYRLAERTGDTLPFSSRPYRQGNYLFELKLRPDEQQRVYLRLESQGSIQAPLTLWSPKAYIQAQPERIYVLGMIYGVLLVMLLYNLLLYVSLRLRAYLYYIAYIASFGLYQVSVNGAGIQYLWPNSPWWANAATPFLIGSAILFGSQFARHFLETPRVGPRWDLLLKGLMVSGAVTMVIAMTSSYGISLRLATALALVFTLIMACVGWVAWFRGMRTARCFIIAWSAFLIGGFVNTLMVLGYLPSNFFTMYASQIGSAMEVGLLSLALADRINHMRDERARLMEASSRELSALNAELTQANRLKDEFLGTLSHELRTPMNGVLGGLELLRPAAHEGERAEYFALADGSARDMLRMVDNLLTLTELQAARTSVGAAPFALRPLLERLRQDYEPRAQAKDVRFHVQLEAGVPDGLIGDAVKLRQVLGHLLDNAVRFTGQGGVSLRVSRTEVQGSSVTLRFDVNDTGIGFHCDNDALYRPFRQLDASMTRAYGGLGIGLAIARQLAELLGGSLHHASAPGEGSRFTLELPLVLQEPVRLPVGLRSGEPTG